MASYSNNKLLCLIAAELFEYIKKYKPPRSSMSLTNGDDIKIGEQNMGTCSFMVFVGRDPKIPFSTDKPTRCITIRVKDQHVYADGEIVPLADSNYKQIVLDIVKKVCDAQM